MGVWHSIGGQVALRLTSSDISSALRLFSQQGIVLYGINLPDPLTAEFVVEREDHRAIRTISERRGDRLELVGRSGIFWRMKALLHRPVLIAGILLLFSLVVVLPTRVLFIQVEGNSGIPAARIMEAAESCGIRFWASRAEVRSERIKNKLLESIPQLQWVGVNTTGSMATISVREREEKNIDDEFNVSRIVACRDGVVSTVVCTAGNALCSPGQAVREGQTLISGFTDCGLSIRAERARGEVFAFTNRKIRAILPGNTAYSTDDSCSGRQISLLIGKKRINLWKDSGISPTGCVKIYEEKWVCLPGGSRLPVSVVVETWTSRDESDEVSADSNDVLSAFVRDYLRSRMISGSILTKSEEFTEEEACLVLTGQYECLEMIGRERGEEIVHGKND